ncbi:unnamed protein product [Closterium sp. NIES-54]
MYALTISAEGDCYLSVPPDPGIGTSETAPPGASASAALGPGETAALGASASAALGPGEAAALGASASAPPGASTSVLAGTASTEVLHTFTLDSGASRCFFRDRTALEQLARPVAVSLADPSGGPVIATSSTVLPCPTVPSGTLSGLYLPSFSTNLVASSALQDGGVYQFTPAYEHVTHCTCARTGRHLATFTWQPGSDLYTLTTESPQVAASASASGQLSAPCSCRSLSHQTVLWHHRLAHPSVQRLRGMHSRYLVSGLPRVLPPLPPSPAPPCLPCVEGRQRAVPHSSSFPPTEAPLQTLHLDVWGPARVRGQGHERYFLLVVNDYTRYTTVFPLRTKGEDPDVLIPWIRAARLQLRDRFQSDFPVLRLHSDRGGEFSSDLLAAYCAEHGIRQTFTLPASPQQNGVAERRIGLVMEIARTSLIHAAASHFLWPFAVQYAAHQLNLWPRVSAPETSPTLLWMGQVGDASRFRDVTFDESVPFYRLFPYRTAPLPPPPLFLTPGAPPVDPLPPQGPAPSGVSQVDAVEPVEVAVDSGPERGTEPGGTETGGAELGGAATGGAEPGGAATGGTATGGTETGGAGPRGSEPEGGDPAGAPSPQRLREWYARRCSLRSGAPRFELPPAGGTGATGGATGAAGGAACAAGGATGANGGTGTTGGAAGAPGGFGAAGGAAGAAGGTGALGGAAGAAGGTGAAGGAAGAAGGTGAAGAGTPGGSGVGTPGGATGAAGVGAAAGGSGGTLRPRPYFVPLLQQVLGRSSPHCPAPSLECPSPVRLQSQFQPASPLPGPSPYTGPTGGLTDRGTTLAALGFSSSTADPSLFLRTDTSLPPFYILVYVDDLVFATADTELQKRHTCIDLGVLTSYLGLRITRDRARRTITLTQSHMVQQVLQRFGFTWSSAQATPLAIGYLLSALPLDESVEPSGPYLELVGCLMYLMTCTRPDLAYPLGLLARYMASVRHRKVHWDAAKRVLRYLCSTSGMGLVLGGRRSVVLTGHSDASWVDDQATQRLSQGYTFSLGSGSVSWCSTRSSSVLSSSCEAEIYATAMAAQELRWLTYLLTDLGERPSSPPVLYVDNKAAIALCQEHRLEHRTKHIALCYFLARELQQRGQLCLRYVAIRANTADIFTKALQPDDHQRFCTILGLVPTVPHLL